MSKTPVLTLYTTIQSTVLYPITRYLVTRYRIISEYVTQIDVDYYDDGFYITRISYPTRYLKSVKTVLIGIETRTASPAGAHTTRSIGGGREQPEVLPVTI